MSEPNIPERGTVIMYNSRSIASAQAAGCVTIEEIAKWMVENKQVAVAVNVETAKHE